MEFFKFHAGVSSESVVFSRGYGCRVQNVVVDRKISCAILGVKTEDSDPSPDRRLLGLEQIFNAGAFFAQFLFGGEHPLAAERINRQALHDLVVAVLADTWIG